MISRPLRDYALLGDTRTAALISSAGSVDWMCYPRFDSAPIFGRLIDAEQGGFLELTVDGIAATQRRYQDASTVLITEWRTSTGRARLTAAMAMDARTPTLLALMECTAGSVRARLAYQPRVGIPGRRARKLPVTLHTTPHVELDDGAWTAELTAGESLAVCLGERRSPMSHGDIHDALARTDRWWQRWTSDIGGGEAYRALMIRSLITLRLLTHSRTGAPVASPTTSLPEELGGVRNWDYRFSWPRDASVGVAAFLAVGLHREARAFVDWLTTACTASPDGFSGIRVLYTLDGERASGEREIRSVSGYEHSLPVRVGNLAARQHQLDVYGWVIDAIWNLVDAGHAIGRRSRAIVADSADYVCARWRRPDAGIWEVRDDPRDYVHSKIWAWIALDRAVRTAHRLNMDRRRAATWAHTRDELATDIRARGVSAGTGCYTRAYGADEMDTSVLLLPLTGFDDPSDPRVSRTVDKIWHELSAGDPLLYRYTPGRDGLPGTEGAFLPCSFWLLEALLRLGRHEEGVHLFEQVVALLNDVALLPEEIDPTSHAYLGNYPLALSHAGLVHAITEVQRVVDGKRGGAKGATA